MLFENRSERGRDMLWWLRFALTLFLLCGESLCQEPVTNSPNGYFTFNENSISEGAVVDITWRSIYECADIFLYQYGDNSTWDCLATHLTSKEYMWTVPSNFGNLSLPFVLRITNAETTSEYDPGDGGFWSEAFMILQGAAATALTQVPAFTIGLVPQLAGATSASFTTKVSARSSELLADGILTTSSQTVPRSSPASQTMSEVHYIFAPSPTVLPIKMQSIQLTVGLGIGLPLLLVGVACAGIWWLGRRRRKDDSWRQKVLNRPRGMGSSSRASQGTFATLGSSVCSANAGLEKGKGRMGSTG